MHDLQRQRDIADQRDRVGNGHRLFSCIEKLPQRFPRNQPHHHERTQAVLARVVHRAKVRVIQAAQ